MRHVLVTGGAGYIGSVLVRQLLERGYRVRVLDSLKFGGDALVDVFLHPNFSFMRGDIRDAATRQAAVQGIDAVAHLAAIVGDPACKLFADEAHEVNGPASEALFRDAEAAGVGQFVFASTCSNYGKMKDPGAFVDENAELRPVSLYAELKVAYEKFLLEQTPNSPVHKTVLRFSTVYGFSPRTRFDLTVNEFTRDAALGKELVIFGEHFWRPYCHVYDLARSVVTVLEADRNVTRNEVYNVGDTTENYSKKMLAEEIVKQVPSLQVKYVHKDEDPRDYRVNFDKISTRLGFAITRRVPDGIREMRDLVLSGLYDDWYAPRFRNT